MAEPQGYPNLKVLEEFLEIMEQRYPNYLHIIYNITVNVTTSPTQT